MAKETNLINRRPAPFVDHYELPASYDSTRVTLMARDPHWIYAYWDIAPSSIENIRNTVGYDFDRAARTIRMYDVTCIDFNGSNANRSFDIDVGPHSNNWYINLWNDNVSYCADLGLRMPDGSFVNLARSNVVTTPRANPSRRDEQIWMEIKEDSPKSPFAIGKIYKTQDTGRRQAPETIPQTQEPEYIKAKRLKKISLTEDDVRSYYSRLSPLLRDIISTRLAGQSRTRPAVYIKGGRSLMMNYLLEGRYSSGFLTGASEKTKWEP